MKWFGTAATSADICAEQVPVPVGECCASCKQPITADDHGLLIPHLGAEDSEWHDQAWHAACFRDMLG
jgi:hypothetical protein